MKQQSGRHYPTPNPISLEHLRLIGVSTIDDYKVGSDVFVPILIPTSAPTSDCVVLTGKPSRVQMVSQVAEPIEELGTYGLKTETIPFALSPTNFSNHHSHDQDAW